MASSHLGLYVIILAVNYSALKSRSLDLTRIGRSSVRSRSVWLIDNSPAQNGNIPGRVSISYFHEGNNHKDQGTCYNYDRGHETYRENHCL